MRRGNVSRWSAVVANDTGMLLPGDAGQDAHDDGDNQQGGGDNRPGVEQQAEPADRLGRRRDRHYYLTT